MSIRVPPFYEVSERVYENFRWKALGKMHSRINLTDYEKKFNTIEDSQKQLKGKREQTIIDEKVRIWLSLRKNRK